MHLAKKGLCVWIFSSLTFISMVHLTEAISVLFLNNQPHLLQLYPLVGDKLQFLPPAMYFLISALAGLVFWGITCGVAFDNPVEQFLNKILSDAKRQSSHEAQMLTDKSEVLDAMCETLDASNETLSHVVDMVCNVRTEVKGIQPLTLVVENIRTDLGHLKKEIKRIEEKGKLPLLCATCGKPLSPEFRLCPFCGETLKLPTGIATVEAYR
jgi:rubrerythrin